MMVDECAAGLCGSQTLSVGEKFHPNIMSKVIFALLHRWMTGLIIIVRSSSFFGRNSAGNPVLIKDFEPKCKTVFIIKTQDGTTATTCLMTISTSDAVPAA
jgi:hypothetical protein